MDLYALPPEEFTAARDAEVRAARGAGEREQAKALAALRRPTASAHAVNALARAEPELLAQLLELGQQLAQAQAAGQGEALRSLGEQRRALVEAVADRAAAAAGRALPPAVRVEVVATLEAALADPASGQAVRTGRLVRPLSYAGFGGVDLQGAVAAATGSPAPAADESHEAPAEARVGDPRQKSAGAGRRKAAGTSAGARTPAGRQPTREQQAREQQARDQQAWDQQAREQQAREQAAREQAARECRRQAAQAAALAATEVLDDAVRAAERAEAERAARAAEAAQAAQDEHAAQRAFEQAQERLERTGEQHRQAAHAEREAAQTLAELHERVAGAQREAERARNALSALA